MNSFTFLAPGNRIGMNLKFLLPFWMNSLWSWETRTRSSEEWEPSSSRYSSAWRCWPVCEYKQCSGSCHRSPAQTGRPLPSRSTWDWWWWWSSTPSGRVGDMGALLKPLLCCFLILVFNFWDKYHLAQNPKSSGRCNSLLKCSDFYLQVVFFCKNSNSSSVDLTVLTSLRYRSMKSILLILLNCCSKMSI